MHLFVNPFYQKTALNKRLSCAELVELGRWLFTKNYAKISTMKIGISNFSGNICKSLRDAGYYPDRNQRPGQDSFSRPLLGDRYPRFHIYYNEKRKELNLHLDHKAPKYENAPDHGAEYSGDLVEKEAQRLKDFFLDS